MTLITESKQLNAFCKRLSSAPFITVDTEFMRDRTYWPKLCVLQLAAPGKDNAAAIDTISERLDLTPVFELFEDQDIVKVFHAARQDIEIFYNLRKIIPRPLFDTQVAAMVCGFGESVGYETLVTRLSGGAIDKTSRFTDWALRPLSRRQIEYAIADVTHLRTIYAKLRDQLETSGRKAWLDEEMGVLLDPGTYRLEPADAWQRLKTRTNKPKFLAVLREIAAWREREAQSRDVPRNRILRDDTVVDIAAHAPTNAETLGRTRGLSASIAGGRIGRAILEAVAKGLKTPPADAPRLAPKPDLPKTIGPTVDLLRVLLKMKCAEHDVAQKLIASTADLERLAADDNANVPALHGWRREIFGDDALAVKHGKLALALNGNRVRLIPTRS
ncbi:MAG: ribonuclease D [Alphaproteobacteria bacterium]|nr:ribonuclease D [Alphaproteobacteria bacterium]